MRRRQPISTRTNTLLPSRTLFRSKQYQVGEHRTSQPPCPAVARSGTQSPGNLARRLSTRGTGAATPSRRPRHAARRRRGVADRHPARAGAAASIPRSRCPLGYRSARSEEHTSELQSLMRISYAVFCLKKNTKIIKIKQLSSQYKKTK